MQPLLSIVIANYNYGRFLEEAIRSVVEQDGFEECELIVVDGGSTDNSFDVIRKYENCISWWVSEKDKGQSNAFNKGFAHAKGKYLTWLNADDVFVNGCILKILGAMKRHPDCRWFTANSFRFSAEGKLTGLIWGPHIYPSFLQFTNSPVVAFGPSTFFAKELFVAVGGMDESLYYVMDTELWMRFIVNRVKQRRINSFCWGFRMHEASKTAEFGDHSLSAEEKMRLNNETQQSCAKNGYHESWVSHLALYALRILDGSYIRGRIKALHLIGYQVVKGTCI